MKRLLVQKVNDREGGRRRGRNKHARTGVAAAVGKIVHQFPRRPFRNEILVVFVRGPLYGVPRVKPMLPNLPNKLHHQHRFSDDVWSLVKIRIVAVEVQLHRNIFFYSQPLPLQMCIGGREKKSPGAFRKQREHFA
jgi:hypothetical protein